MEVKFWLWGGGTRCRTLKVGEARQLLTGWGAGVRGRGGGYNVSCLGIVVGGLVEEFTPFVRDGARVARA